MMCPEMSEDCSWNVISAKYLHRTRPTTHETIEMAQKPKKKTMIISIYRKRANCSAVWCIKCSVATTPNVTVRRMAYGSEFVVFVALKENSVRKLPKRRKVAAVRTNAGNDKVPLPKVANIASKIVKKK
jgi:hypothetical protein